jgi:predicted ATPase
VTVVGPGGIGKTTLALAAAEALSATYADGVAFLDLAPIGDPALLPGALASVLGVPGHVEGAASALPGFLRDRAMLLVL